MSKFPAFSWVRKYSTETSAPRLRPTILRRIICICCARISARKNLPRSIIGWASILPRRRSFSADLRGVKNNLLWSGTSATNIMTYAANCANVSDAVADPLVGSAQASQAEGKRSLQKRAMAHSAFISPSLRRRTSRSHRKSFTGIVACS